MTPFKSTKRIPNDTPVGSSATNSKKKKKNLFSYKPLFAKIPERNENNNNQTNKQKIANDCEGLLMEMHHKKKANKKKKKLH